MMNTIKFKCRIITPLFMGGANQQPELRTQSFNGLFRYWFRLLGGGLEDEKRLFGWGGKNASKGLVQINLESPPQITLISGLNLQKIGEGIRYLGFSLSLTKRQGITNNSNNNFNISFRFHPTATEDDIKKFLCAVWCAFYLGNFGSRGRRGFGSIVVENVEGDTKGLRFKPDNTSIEQWLKEQLNYIKGLNYWQPRNDIPYIFKNMKIFKVEKNNFGKWREWIEDVQRGRSGRYSWNLNSINRVEELLDFMGFLLMAYRSYYQPDYNIARSIIQSQRNFQQNPTIERVIFGLPLNFYFSSFRRGRMVEAKLRNVSLRRASPLIFKIIASNDNFEGFMMVFKPNDEHKFKFLPQGATINLRGVNLNQPGWKAIDNFLQTLRNQNLLRRVWP